jgi:hypothetical protein
VQSAFVSAVHTVTLSVDIDIMDTTKFNSCRPYTLPDPMVDVVFSANEEGQFDFSTGATDLPDELVDAKEDSSQSIPRMGAKDDVWDDDMHLDIEAPISEPSQPRRKRTRSKTTSGQSSCEDAVNTSPKLLFPSLQEILSQGEIIVEAWSFRSGRQ